MIIEKVNSSNKMKTTGAHADLVVQIRYDFGRLHIGENVWCALRTEKWRTIYVGILTNQDTAERIM
jgi:hypothetical protein